MLLYFVVTIFTFLIADIYGQNVNGQNDDYIDYDMYDQQNTNRQQQQQQHNYPNQGFQSYSVVKDEPRKPGQIECYSCHYQYKNGEVVGSTSCNIKFEPKGIPRVTCIGQCGLVVVNNLKDGFMLTRNCMEHCAKYKYIDGYRQCCSTDLCNGSDSPALKYSLTLVMVCIASALLAPAIAD